MNYTIRISDSEICFIVVRDGVFIVDSNHDFFVRVSIRIPLELEASCFAHIASV